MVARVSTVAFEGVEAPPIDVQVQLASGNVAFMIVGLGDKAVAESRERVRAALIASGLALPARRITVNLAPPDMPKEGKPMVHRCPSQFSKPLISLMAPPHRGTLVHLCPPPYIGQSLDKGDF